MAGCAGAGGLCGCRGSARARVQATCNTGRVILSSVEKGVLPFLLYQVIIKLSDD